MCNYFRNTQPMKIEEIVVIEKGVRLEETVSKVSDKTFHWTDYRRVGARICITLEGGAEGMVYAALRLFPADHVIKPLPEILPIPTVSYLLRDRVTGSGKSQNILRSTYAQFGCGPFNYAMDFECQLCPKSWLVSSVYNVGDAVELLVFVETNAAARRIYSDDGTLQWTIESWARKREALLDRFADSYRSLYFYADGYRVQAWISIATGTESSKFREKRRAWGSGANGDEEDVLVTIVFLTGVNDHRLTKCYPHSTTVTLKNPRHPDQSVVSQSVERDLEQASRYQLIFPAERVPFYSLLADDSFLLDVVITAN